jgi:hypothetical protein
MNGSTPPFAASCDCNVPQAITSASRGIDRAGAESGARYVVLVSDPERARASVYDNDGDDPPDDHTPRTVHRPPGFFLPTDGFLPLGSGKGSYRGYRGIPLNTARFKFQT